MDARAHIYRAFDRELSAQRNQLREMGALVEAQIADATKAFVERDPALAGRVIEMEESTFRERLR
jgi:phosphate transport system protein